MPALRRRLAQALLPIVGADVRSLALLRIGLGLLCLADLTDRGADLQAHYTDLGVLPRSALIGDFLLPQALCLHLVGGTRPALLLLFGLHACLACGLALGHHSKLCSVGCWALMTSLHLRNPMVLQGGDDLLRLLLFWGMFLPLGACYSLDHARRLAAAGAVAAPRRRTVVGAASVALLGQVLLMYFNTAHLKTGDAWHAAGTAVHDALHFDQLALRPALWLREMPQLTTPLTHLTMFWETFGPLTLICPWGFWWVRSAGIAAFMGMHHAFACFLMLGLFPWIDTVSLLALLPGGLWTALQRRPHLRRRRAAQARAVLYHDADCRSCRVICFVLREFLLLGSLSVQAAGEDPEAARRVRAAHAWVLAERPPGRVGASAAGDSEGAGASAVDSPGSDGRDQTAAAEDGARAWSAGFAVFARLCALSPLLWWLRPLLQRPSVERLGARLYGAVAARRSLWAGWVPAARRPLPGTGVLRRARGGAREGFVCLSFVAVLAWNVAAWPQAPVAFPAALATAMRVVRLDQDWGMFARAPQLEDGWYVAAGRRVDGRPVDALRRQVGEVSFAKPALISELYGNQRWSKYFLNLWLAGLAGHRLHYARWLCRSYNGLQPNPDDPAALLSFDLIFMREMTLAGERDAAPEKVVLWRHRCF